MKTARPLILVVNPGSTSTKIAVFKGCDALFEETLEHDPAALRTFAHVAGQRDYREAAITRFLERHSLAAQAFDLVIGRGGLLHPLPGGVYAVNAAMLRDLSRARYGEHASNLGAIIAHRFARAGRPRTPAYIANPVVVDELSDVARLTGHPAIRRRSIFHALNQKAVAERVAARMHKPYRRCRFVVAHAGGGISIGVHLNGRVVDVNNALEGDGPFTPERTGALPLIPFYRYALEKKLSVGAAAALVSRRGGLLAHLGTNDCRQIVSRIRRGDSASRLALEAFVYQLAKALGAAAAALDGRVDAVILTGNVMKSGWILRRLRRKVGFIAPIHVITDNSELAALAHAALGAWQGTRRVHTYYN